MKIALGVIITICMLFGIKYCCENTLHCQEVCKFNSKRFVPAHTEYWTEMRCAMYDKDGFCISQIPEQHSRHVPDKWHATYVDCQMHFHEEEITSNMFTEPARTVIHTHLRWKQCPCGEPLRPADFGPSQK